MGEILCLSFNLLESQKSPKFPQERKNSVPRVALKPDQIDNDLSMIHRLADQAIQTEENEEV